jgi:hypothetical protein
MEFYTIKDFLHFVNWYQGELILKNNKAYEKGELKAIWIQQSKL